MPKLVYFATRGRAEIIRMLCAEAAVQYEEENFENKEFAALKATGRLPFQAVPVWEEEGGFRLAQSYAIFAHLARTHGLYGSTSHEAALVDQALWTAEDLRIEYRKIISAEPAKRADVRAELLRTSLPRFFHSLEKVLGANDFFAGKTVTAADLALWYPIEMARDNGLDAPLADCPRLNAWFERVASRPKIAAYLKSPKRFPVFKLPV